MVPTSHDNRGSTIPQTFLCLCLSTTNLFVEVKIITIISFFGWGRGRWVGGWQKGKPVIYEFLVSKETVVLRRWERSKQKFGFIKRVDKG